MPTFSGTLGVPNDFPKDFDDYTYDANGTRKFDYELEVTQEGKQLIGYLGLVKADEKNELQKYALIRSAIFETVSHDNADHHAFELLDLYVSTNPRS